MRRNYKIITLLALAIVAFGALGWYLHGTTIPVLEPQGAISHKERNLIIFTSLLAVVVVVPTFALTIFIVWKYRESNPRPKQYTPEWDHSRVFESIWWGVPTAIILVLSVVAWNSAHDLDPFKSLASGAQPVTVQVVSLDWKWLFIYPKQHIASVNMVEFPKNTPVNFQLTSDTIMNSFWIPQLGGQIYTMPGMSTQLHLSADKLGSYYGTPANIAGRGFSRMTFTAKAVSNADFASWVKSNQKAPKVLNQQAYHKLAKPSESNPVAYYSSVPNGIFNDIIMKYMMPSGTPAMHTNRLTSGNMMNTQEMTQ